MSNCLADKIERICKDCQLTMPIASFRQYQRKSGPKSGQIKTSPYCKKCDDKRRYLRARATPESWRRALDLANNSAKAKRELNKPIYEVGSFSVAQWHKCDKCSSVQLIRKEERHDCLCKKCRRFENAKGVKTGKRGLKTAICKQCGDTHKSKWSNAMCQPCADEKKKLSRKAYKALTRKKYGTNHRKRARYYGCYYEPIKVRDVYIRDGWKCYQCGCKVILSKKYDPKRATIDHIIPLSMGGPHSYDNVKTMCFMCNSMKSDKVLKPTQLSLLMSDTGERTGGM